MRNVLKYHLDQQASRWFSYFVALFGQNTCLWTFCVIYFKKYGYCKWNPIARTVSTYPIVKTILGLMRTWFGRQDYIFRLTIDFMNFPSCYRLTNKIKISRQTMTMLRMMSTAMLIKITIMIVIMIMMIHSKTTMVTVITTMHDDVIKWKHFPRNWPFVRGIHRSPVNSPNKGQWRGALMFSLICV